MRVHFGLGATEKIDEIEVEWPSGVKQQIPPPKPDQIITIEESKPSK